MSDEAPSVTVSADTEVVNDPEAPEASEAAAAEPLEQGLLAKDVDHRDDEHAMEVMDDQEPKDSELPSRKNVPDTPLHLAAFHIFKGNVGIGMFLLPMVYNDMGYVLSPMVAVPLGVVVIDCMVTLLKSKVGINRSRIQTYPEVAEFVFGSLMRVVVNGALIMTQLSFCLMYMQSAGTIFSELATFDHSYKAFVALQLLLVMPLTFLTHNLKLLAVASATATFLVWFTVIGTVVYFSQQVRDQEGMNSTTTATGFTSKWPLFICSNIFALEGVGVVLPIENATASKDKRRLPMMIAATMGLIVTLYMFYGMFGMAAYGCELKNTSVTVLPTSPFGNLVRCGLAINLLLTYPIQFVPAIQIIDRALGIPAERTGGKSKKATLTRVCINIFIMMLAMLLGGDALELIASFIGATAAVFLALILPALLGLHTTYAIENESKPRVGGAYFKAMFTLQPSPVTRAKFFAYLGIGIIVFCIGTATCLIDTASIVKRMTHRGGSAPPPTNGTAAKGSASCDL